MMTNSYQRLLRVMVTLFTFHFSLFTSTAQPQCTVTHYDEFSGMAQWWVTQIVQDTQGAMWFATWNGLNRYDGYQFECFKSQAGDGIDMPSDRIGDLLLAKDGNLRCFVDGRIFGFSTKTCQFFKLSESEEQQLKDEFSQLHRQEEAFERAGIPNIYQDVYGTEWAIHQNGRLMYKNRATGDYVDYPADWHGVGRIRFCTADKEGNAWFTSSYGIFKLTFRQKAYQFIQQEKADQVRNFFLDRQQRYWTTTRDHAIIQLYDRNNRMLGYLGRDGQLHANYTSFGSPIYHIMQDSKGNYWLSSKPDGLFRLREVADGRFSVEHFTHNDQDQNSLKDNELYYTVEDAWGRLWIASFNGSINCAPTPQDEHPRFLHMDNGLKLPKNIGLRVRQLHITQGHILLAATTRGLFIADISPKDPRQIAFKLHVKDVNRNNSLSNNATMYVAEDSKQRIYVCTESGGVNQIISDDLLADNLEFRHFNMSTGIPSDVALSAVPWGEDMVIVSNNQILLLKPDADYPQNFEAFFWKDRLRFSDATPLQRPDGQMMFGLQNGAFTLDFSNLRKSGFVPPIVFTRLSIENGPVDKAVDRLDTLILPARKRDFFLQFAALDYSAEGTIDYAFRLGEGAWNTIGKDHSVTFLDQKPGTYQLQIRSTNSDGVWVDNIRTLTIIVEPTFWETRWAQLLFAIIFAIVVWGLLRTRRYIVSLNRRQKELHEAYLELLNARQSAPVAEKTEEQPARPKMKPEDEAFMQRAIQFIEKHLGDADINIGDMAEATATSRSGLNRKMKSLLGVTPLDFIREARIRKACQMLEEGSSVNDVAYACGFSDPKYFGKCFKAEMGMTPTEYKVEKSAI